jgi:TatD DNase family protein
MASQDGRASIFIDSHAHLADPAFAGDRDAVISRARQAGAAAIVCIGESLDAAAVAATIAADNAGFVFATAGIHPHDAASFDPSRDVPRLREFLSAGAIAVGECGLDYHYENSPRDLQRDAFSAQLELAEEMAKPVVVHTRDAEDDTRSLIAEARVAGVIGVLHCYTGSHSLAELAIEAGWYVSFSGIVTFKKWTDDDLLRLVPDDRLLVESDSPYLAPQPHRGKRNEPAWVSHTVARVAAARDVNPFDLGAMTAANTERLFGLAFRAA